MIVTGNTGQEEKIVITGLSPATSYSFEIAASDLAGNTAVNNPKTIPATTGENSNTGCSGQASDAIQGNFSVGYTYTFETIGNDVKITFELLDEKSGVIAYLWKESPFSEVQMNLVSGKKFTQTLTNQTIGETISYGCKFAFAGGLAVTDYISYKVGDACDDGLSNEKDRYREMKVFPNPTTGKVYVSIPKSNKEVFVDVFNAYSQVVVSEKIKVSNETIVLDLSNQSAGVYYIKLKLEEPIIVKVIKN